VAPKAPVLANVMVVTSPWKKNVTIVAVLAVNVPVVGVIAVVVNRVP